MFFYVSLLYKNPNFLTIVFNQINQEMKTSKNLLKACIAVALLFMIPFSSNASKEVTLRLNLEKGSSSKHRTTINQTTTQSMGGMQQEVKQNQIFEYTIDVKGKDSQGNIDAQITYNRVAIDMNTAGMSFSFDSNDKEEAASNPQFKGFAALIDKSVDVKFSPRADVLEVSGIEGLLENMVNELSGGDEAMKAQMKQGLKDSFNEESMKQMFGGAYVQLPERAVKVGSTWVENQSVVNQFTLNVINNYAVKAIEGNSVSVDVTSTIATVPGSKANMQGMEVAFNLFGTQSGNIKIDAKNGTITESELNQNISGNMSADMMGQKMDIPMTIISIIKTERIN